VTEDPSKRQVPLERAVAWVAEEIAGVELPSTVAAQQHHHQYSSPDSKRSSGYWTQNEGWDSCHEVNAKDGEGIEEVFRVIAKRLVEQRNQRDVRLSRNAASSVDDDATDYFNGNHPTTGGSFRLGHGDRDKRRSWLGLPSVGLEGAITPKFITTDPEVAREKGRCC
jgi:hypothetical protein